MIHFSILNDAAHIELTLHSGSYISVESFSGSFCCGLFLRVPRRIGVLRWSLNGSVSPHKQTCTADVIVIRVYRGIGFPAHASLGISASPDTNRYQGCAFPISVTRFPAYTERCLFLRLQCSTYSYCIAIGTTLCTILIIKLFLYLIG